jgi:hypothetical protein
MTATLSHNLRYLVVVIRVTVNLIRNQALEACKKHVLQNGDVRLNFDARVTSECVFSRHSQRVRRILTLQPARYSEKGEGPKQCITKCLN